MEGRRIYCSAHREKRRQGVPGESDRAGSNARAAQHCRILPERPYPASCSYSLVLDARCGGGSQQYDLGLEEGSSNTGADGNQLGLSAEDPHKLGIGVVGKIESHAMADLLDSVVVRRKGRKVRQELAGMQEWRGFSCT